MAHSNTVPQKKSLTPIAILKKQPNFRSAFEPVSTLNRVAMPAPTPNKPRVIKDYEKLDASVLEQIKLEYPRGFRRNLITFKNAKGDTVSALPFETEDRYYLVRMTVKEAQAIIADDEDYDDDGNLKARVKRAYTAKHDDDYDDEEEDNALDFDLGEDLNLAEEDDDFDGDVNSKGDVNIDDVDVVDPDSV